MIKTGELLLWTGSAQYVVHRLEASSVLHNLVLPEFKVTLDYLYYSHLEALALINNILRDTLQSLSTFHTGIIMNHQLPTHNRSTWSTRQGS